MSLMRHYLIYYYLLITFYIQQLYSLRCKCNANRGPSPCIGDFCDIHNRDGKRAACGALRRSRQTIFACVLIRQTSNDTYCHVIGSTTACWCRQMDFCNADLEAELFDVDESADDDSKADSDSEESTSTSSSSPPITTSLPPPSSSSPLSSLSSPLLATDQISDNQQQHEFFIDAAIQQVPMNFHTVTTVSPVLSLTIATSTATTVRPADFSVIKQTRKTHINPAIPIDIVEKIKLTPQQRENPPTVVAETISDSYEYELDENDDGFHWHVIAIPDDIISAKNTSSRLLQSTNSPKSDDSAKSQTMEISLANLSISASVIKATITASHEVVSPTAATFATTERVHATSPTDKISVRDNDNDSGMDPTLEQFSAANLQSSSLNNDEKLSNEKISITKLQLAQVTNSLLEPIIHLATTTMISSAHNADKTEANFTKFNLFETTQRIPELQLTMNNTSPIITYNHLAPKTRLDQWEQKENFKQEQQTNWISDSDKNDSADDNDHDHGNSDINNYDNTNRSRSVKLSFNFSIFLFSLLSHLFLLSFLQNHY